MSALISTEELKARIDRHDPVTIVEALPAGAYAQGHLPGAVNVPPDRVAELAARVLPDKRAAIVVHCTNDT